MNSTRNTNLFNLLWICNHFWFSDEALLKMRKFLIPCNCTNCTLIKPTVYRNKKQTALKNREGRSARDSYVLLLNNHPLLNKAEQTLSFCIKHPFYLAKISKAWTFLGNVCPLCKSTPYKQIKTDFSVFLPHDSSLFCLYCSVFAQFFFCYREKECYVLCIFLILQWSQCT